MSSTVGLPIPGLSPFSLAIQLNQMKAFQAKVYEQGSSDYLPSADIFGKSLYTFSIGQNDFTSDLGSIGIPGVHQRLPEVVNQIAWTIREAVLFSCKTSVQLHFLKEHGCMVSYNNEVVNYNTMLKDVLTQARKDLPDASIIYIDTHSIILGLFRNLKDHGFEYGLKACCGHGGGTYNFDLQLWCGTSNVINGSTVTSTACEDPYHYLSWDGIHTTEAANKLITEGILSGSYFDPPFALKEHCDIQPIG